MVRIIGIGLLLMMSSLTQAKVIGNQVEYVVDGTRMTGYLAYDDAIKGKRPGILVVHEWWGHNAYARKRADQLAGLGYTAFALDMYGSGKVADHPKDAKKFMTEVTSNMATARARYSKAIQLLKENATTDNNRIAAIGYCFGGGVVLDMARQGADVKGVVSFHGSIGTQEPAKKGKVKAKVLVLNGAADPFVKPEQIDAFRKEMQQANVNFQFINYPGAKHAFTNPDATALGKKFNMPLEYNASADKKSWQQMKKFFDGLFRKK